MNPMECPRRSAICTRLKVGHLEGSTTLWSFMAPKPADVRFFPPIQNHAQPGLGPVTPRTWNILSRVSTPMAVPPRGGIGSDAPRLTPEHPDLVGFRKSPGPAERDSTSAPSCTREGVPRLSRSEPPHGNQPFLWTQAGKEIVDRLPTRSSIVVTTQPWVYGRGVPRHGPSRKKKAELKASALLTANSLILRALRGGSLEGSEVSMGVI